MASGERPQRRRPGQRTHPGWRRPRPARRCWSGARCGPGDRRGARRRLRRRLPAALERDCASSPRTRGMSIMEINWGLGAGHGRLCAATAPDCARICSGTDLHWPGVLRVEAHALGLATSRLRRSAQGRSGLRRDEIAARSPTPSAPPAPVRGRQDRTLADVLMEVIQGTGRPHRQPQPDRGGALQDPGPRGEFRGGLTGASTRAPAYGSGVSTRTQFRPRRAETLSRGVFVLRAPRHGRYRPER